MKVETFVGTVGCLGGECPTIYKTDRDTFVVQGNVLNPTELSGVRLPVHEGLIEIPAALVRALASKLASE